MTFGVPGAQVKLGAGNYGVKRETLAFKGNLSMDAKISETVSGFKSILLKAADPLFRRKGGRTATSRSRSKARATNRSSASTSGGSLSPAADVWTARLRQGSEAQAVRQAA